jgi:oligopeptide transport system substrate-binding protein
VPTALLCCVLLVVLTGCRRPETPVDSGVRGQVLHLPLPAEPSSLDPQIVSGAIEDAITSSLFEGLVALDPMTHEVRPGAAARWEISGDGLTYTFHLQPGGRWSDGEPVTAADFVTAYRRLLTPALGASEAVMLDWLEGAESYRRGETGDFSTVGVRARSERVLELRLRAPVPFLLPMLARRAWFPVRLAVIERHGPGTSPQNRWARPGTLVGNGPFQLAEWQANQSIVLRPNPHYWDRAAVRLAGIRYQSAETAEAQERMFRAGQLHLTGNVPPSRLDHYRRMTPSPLHISPTRGTVYLRVNVSRPPLDDGRVRRALSLAVDRVRLTGKVMKAGQQPASHFTPPGTGGFHAGVRPHFDPAEARRLLAAAGYPGGVGFPRVELVFNSIDTNRLMAEALQEMWRRHLAIEVTLVNVEWRVYLGSITTGDYGLARSGWTAGYDDPLSFLTPWVTGDGNNCTSWGDPRYDALIQQARRTHDSVARHALFQQMEDLLAAELPVIPLYFGSTPRLIHPAVRGWRPHPLDYSSWKGVWLEDSRGN